MICDDRRASVAPDNSMAAKRRPMLVDTKAREVADHFLDDVKGATEADRIELAELIQHVCEGCCLSIEEREGRETT